MRKLVLAGLVSASFMFGIPAATCVHAAPAVSADSAAKARRVVLVKRYFVATNLEATVGQMMNQMMPVLLEQQRKSNPSITQEQVKIISDSIIEAMAEFMPGYMDRMADMYADAFTEDELTQMVAFYESPVGRSITGKMPAMIPKATQIMIDMMPGLQSSMQKKMCSKMDCGASAPKP